MVLSALACVATRRLLKPILPQLRPDLPREVARDLVEHNFMSSTTSLWNVLYRRDVTLDLNALPEDLPVVFIHGTDDATAPIGSIRRLAKRRSSSQLVELAGVDHHPWLRRPSEVGRLITTSTGVGRTSYADREPDEQRISWTPWNAGEHRGFLEFGSEKL